VISFLLCAYFSYKHRGTEQDVLEELKILAKLKHDYILCYYNSWSEPAEYHEERDEEVFRGSEFSRSPASARGSTSTRLGTTCDGNGSVRDVRTTDSGSLVIFESSSENQSAKNISTFSIDDTTSSQNDRSEKKAQKRSEPYEYLFFVTDLCKNESLKDRLLPEYRSINKIDRFNALYIFYQIVEGVRYLHNAMNLVTYFLILVLFVTSMFFFQIHCDLKPANILFSLGVEDTVKIADFGLTLTQKALVPTDDDLNPNELQQAAGTKFYMSPAKESVSFKRDIYALGIILFELLYPFSSDTERAKV
jgi:translation initiation factor 2-alpha kinase 3